MFSRLGALVAANPVVCILIWISVAAVMILVSPKAEELTRHEPRSLLPPDAHYNRSLEFERTAFPQLASRTRTVLIFERPSGLTPDDNRALAELSGTIVADLAPREGWTVLSPYANPLLTPRLRSADGQAVMFVVQSDSNYLTARSVAGVERLDAFVRERISDELTFEITGEGGLGRDLSAVSEVALARTTEVTLLALVVLLGVVYRAPLAAFVPLACIGVSVIIALMLLNQLTRIGWGLSNIERALTVVLVFGSGVDFALFWLAGYREHLASGHSRPQSAANATGQTGPAIFGSAATTICGLLMLMAADLVPSFNAGRALAVALTVSLAAALTLVPAMALVMKSALFWPRELTSRTGDVEREYSRVWSAVARLVSHHPARAVFGVLVVLAWPAYRGWTAHYTYDALGVIPDDTSAARGRAIANAHFSAEQLFSWSLMITHGAITGDVVQAADLSSELADLCRNVPGIVDVWNLSAPLGGPPKSGVGTLASGRWAREQAKSFYLDVEHHALRAELLLDAEPLSERAMTACGEALRRVEYWAHNKLGADAKLYATGLTPYIINIRKVADADHARILTWVIVVILLIVLALVRDAPLALVMLAATVLVYVVTMGVTERLFVNFAGAAGIDWKVRLFAFVILVAVGQDYNIFLVTRLLHERKTHDARTAVRRAIVATGSVISSCGLIMAATLGSLAATGLPFFQQMGIAFAFGVLLDTFLIRPIVVPAIYLLIRGR